MKCRHCYSDLPHVFVDLGFAPPSNSYLSSKKLYQPEKYYPLIIKVCDKCWLVQTVDFAEAEDLFDCDYAYFSSTSEDWLSHAKAFSEEIIPKLGLDGNSTVIEIASNDGYLLQNFISRGIPCLGIEPTASTAEAAEQKGIPVIREFFDEELAVGLVKKGMQADLVVGNNVLAHVPDINGFAAGLKRILKEKGIIVIEFPHLLNLLNKTQFDTIYHEHFSYLSLFAVKKIFESAGIQIYDVQEISTHGGSLRIYCGHLEVNRLTTSNVSELLDREIEAGMFDLRTYEKFQAKVNAIKDGLLKFLIKQKSDGKLVLGYGAAAKGSTLLNYAGIRPDLLPIIFDAAPSKQGMFMPGSHIPILPPQEMKNFSPDFLLILPWNIASEVKRQYASMEKLGTKFVIAVPELKEV